MARTQAKNYDAVRDGLLATSATLFRRQGYAATSIADLARGNGVSRGLLYHYFESKEALLREMLDRHLDMMLAEVRAAAETEGDAEARLRRTIGTIVRINAGSQDLQVVLLHDLQNLHATDRKRIVAKQNAIVDAVRDLVEGLDRQAGHLKRTAAARGRLSARTMLLIGMMNYTYLWYDPAGPVTPEAYAEMVAETWFRGNHPE